jgi:hypothetical protein
MKKYCAWIVYTLLGCLSAWSAEQGTPPTSVTESGPHHRLTETTVREQMPDGQEVVRKIRTMELATGLHYRSGDQWLETRELIEAHPNGAVAHYGPHKAAFAANLNTYGAIQLVDENERRFTSHILGLAYTDAASGESVLIASLKDSAGQILPPNQIVYLDAFTEFEADVRYTYRRNGFEQDIILRQAPPSPVTYGLNPATTRLEVLTEFVEAPEATVTTQFLRVETEPALRRAMVLPDLTDQTLNFGALAIGKGIAFDFQGVLTKEVSVGKSWEVLNGRTVLIEAVELSAIDAALQALNAPAAGNPNVVQGAALKAVPGQKVVGRSLPNAPRQRAAADQKPMKQMAQLNLQKGLLIDYSTQLITGKTNFVFEPWATYTVLGPVNLYGLTTIMGGTAVKYASDTANSYISLNGGIVCDTTPYRPAVFTATKDNSIGTTVTAGSASTYYGVAALRASTTVTGELHNLRFNFHHTAIDWTGSTQRFSNLQFMNCSNAIRVVSGTNQVHNILATNVLNLFAGSAAIISAQHVTANRVGALSRLTGAPSEVALTNGVLLNVTNLGSGTLTADYVATNGTPTITGVANGFAATTPVFQTSVGGDHYLTTNSLLRDAGTTNIAANLAVELRKATTFAPQYLTNLLGSDVTLSVTAYRDTDVPDLGYHYAPLDAIVSRYIIRSNATVYLTNGVAIGVEYSALLSGAGWGFIFNGGNMLSSGSPLYPNRIVRAHGVQERSTGNPGTRAMFYDGGVAADSSARFRFTEISSMVEDGYSFYGGSYWKNVEFTHCNLYMGGLGLSTGTGRKYGLTNSIWERSSFTLSSSSSTDAVHLRNNLMRYSYLDLYGGTTNWTVRDNLFDTMVQLSEHGGTVSNSHNAYFGTNLYFTASASNLILGSLTYQIGTLGKYYLPTNSPVLESGSRNADLAGLYHFTMTTNNVKETNSVVDVGFHYVATDAFGIPLDYDGDTYGDWFEDIDGDGVSDAGEMDWTSYNSPLGIGSGAGLKVFTPFQ